MWYSIKKMIFYLGILFLLSMQSVQAKEYIVMTEDFAPYGYIENGALTGLSVEIVREIFKILQHLMI